MIQLIFLGFLFGIIASVLSLSLIFFLLASSCRVCLILCIQSLPSILPVYPLTSSYLSLTECISPSISTSRLAQRITLPHAYLACAPPTCRTRLVIRGRNTSPIPTGLAPGHLSREPDALPLWRGRTPRMGTHWKASLSTLTYHTLSSPRECQIGAVSSERPVHSFHLFQLPLLAKYPPTVRPLLICLGTRHHGLAFTPQMRIIPGL